MECITTNFFCLSLYSFNLLTDQFCYIKQFIYESSINKVHLLNLIKKILLEKNNLRKKETYN